MRCPGGRANVGRWRLEGAARDKVGGRGNTVDCGYALQRRVSQFPVSCTRAMLSWKIAGGAEVLLRCLRGLTASTLASRSACKCSFHLISFPTRRTDHRVTSNCMLIKTPSRCPSPFLRQTHIFKRGRVVPAQGSGAASGIAVRSIGCVVGSSDGLPGFDEPQVSRCLSSLIPKGHRRSASCQSL
jgi:hypothetical protein